MKADIIVKREGGQKATPWPMDRRRPVAQVPYPPARKAKPKHTSSRASAHMLQTKVWDAQWGHAGAGGASQTGPKFCQEICYLHCKKGLPDFFLLLFEKIIHFLEKRKKYKVTIIKKNRVLYF